VHDDARGDEGVEVLATVLLVVDDDDVRSERRDRVDVGVLRTADRRDAGLLAEPRAGDRRDAQREERLGCRRYERDRVQRGSPYIRSSSWAFFFSNSSAER
jgi:hypothetical protein